MFSSRQLIAVVVAMAGLSTSAQAGIFSTLCAERSISQAYRNPLAIALVKAAERGDAAEIAALEKKEPGVVNTLEEGAVPPLLWAICADNVTGFEALLKAGADPNLAGNGSGPSNGKGHGVKEDGFIVSPGWSAMLMAAAAGNLEFLRLAVRHGGDLNAERGVREPNRPLLIAAYYGLFDNVKMLVEAGADINARGRKQSAPEYALGIGGRFDIAVWLVEHGYTNDFQHLAVFAEISHVPLDGEQQRWKEKLISMLRARGAVFPASPGVKRGLAERAVPPSDIEDIVLGHKNVLDYPKKAESR